MKEDWQIVEEWLISTEDKLNNAMPEVAESGQRIRIYVSAAVMERFPDAPEHFKQRWTAQK